MQQIFIPATVQLWAAFELINFKIFDYRQNLSK